MQLKACIEYALFMVDKGSITLLQVSDGYLQLRHQDSITLVILLFKVVPQLLASTLDEGYPYGMREFVVVDVTKLVEFFLLKKLKIVKILFILKKYQTYYGSVKILLDHRLIYKGLCVRRNIS